MTSKSKRPARTLLGVFAVTAGLLCAACGSSSAESAPKLDELTVVLDWTPNTNHSGLYLAKSEGWYRDAGIALKIIEPGDAGALQLLASGKADVAVSPQEELVPARAQGIPVVAIAALIEHNTSSLLSLAEDGLTSPADLVGHTYGGYGGPLEKALVEKLVTCSGGDTTKVRFAEVGDVDYRVGLERNQYDFVWIYDGWDKIRMAELEKVKVSTIPFDENLDCIPDWYTPMLATTETNVDKKAELLGRFMSATRKGYQGAMADPTSAADSLLAAVPELDRELVTRSAAYLAIRYADDPNEWGLQDTKVWTRFGQFLLDSGLIDEPIDVKKAFTNRFLESP